VREGNTDACSSCDGGDGDDDVKYSVGSRCGGVSCALSSSPSLVLSVVLTVIGSDDCY